MPTQFDTIIENGTLFDGTGAPRRVCHIGIKDGCVTSISNEPFPEGCAKQVVDARHKWVSPGFIDFHTHYDGEIEVDSGLSESVRHGITTIFMGSCSLGASLGTAEDIADIFCRVEGIPRSVFLPILQKRKDFNSFTQYFEHLDSLPLGPNVTSFVPHSNIRMKVMGFSRSVDPAIKSTKEERKQMCDLLEEGLDAGYVGLSIQTLPWDKLDGDRCRSQPLPSFFAPWSEYRSLTRILRKRDRIFQGVPNLVTKVNVFLFLIESMGIFRKPLKTTIISVVDLICDRKLWWLIPGIARITNTLFGGNFRFQALPNVFDVWADGMDLVIFEEFGAGSEAMHLAQLSARTELLRDPSYRKRFKRQWGNLFLPRVYHRQFQHTEIIDCPDKSVIGKSFADVAAERNEHVIDSFLDLCADHEDKLRWYSVMGNDRPKPLKHIAKHPDILIGFSDAGAHLRNMAFYNYTLRLLKMAKDGGPQFMTMERAFHRLTGEPADWFGINAGVLKEGCRADLVVIDPEGLDDTLEMAHEQEMSCFDGLVRMVRRNPKAVPLVLINGKMAIENGEPTDILGKEKMGRVLRAGA